MQNFDHIFNWKLLKGSHDFPGPDGGSCINEAAIVAAGFAYKKVESVHDCPPCFSRPIAAYAIKLNDSMPDALRNKLLIPFVTKLSGTADTRENEGKRVNFIVLATIQRILSLTCETRLKRPDLANKCRNVKTIAEGRAVAQEVRKIADAAAADAAAYAYAAAAAYAAADAAAYAAADAADAADAAAADAAAYAAADAAYAAYAAADAAAYADAAAADAAYADAAAKEKIFTIATEILGEAILLGKHTELEACEVTPRLEKAKREKVAA